MNEHVFYAQDWEVVERDGRWHCEQYHNEVMRFGADGSFGIGGSRAPIRSYPFLTREWAEACLHRMQEMDRAFAPPEYRTLKFNSLHRLGVGSGVGNHFEFRSSGREVIRVGQGGAIERIDLPFLVWAWLRNTPLVRGLKRLWYGERGQA